MSHAGALAEGAEERGALSRRSLVRGAGAALGALLGAAGSAAARREPPEVSADVDPGALLSKLVRRTTMGIDQVEYDRAVALGYHGYLEYQLNHTSIDDAALEAMLAPFPTLGNLLPLSCS